MFKFKSIIILFIDIKKIKNLSGDGWLHPPPPSSVTAFSCQSSMSFSPSPKITQTFRLKGLMFPKESSPSWKQKFQD